MSGSSYNRLDSISREIDEFSSKPLHSSFSHLADGVGGRTPSRGRSDGTGFGQPIRAFEALSPVAAHNNNSFSLMAMSSNMYEQKQDMLEKVEARLVTQLENVLSRQRKLERSLHDQNKLHQEVIRKKDAELLLVKRGTLDVHADLREQNDRMKEALEQQKDQYTRLKARLVKLESKPEPVQLAMPTDAVLAAKIDERVRASTSQIVTAIGELIPRVRRLETTGVNSNKEEDASALPSLDAKLRAVQFDLQQLPQQLNNKFKYRLQTAEDKWKGGLDKVERKTQEAEAIVRDLGFRVESIDALTAQVNKLERAHVQQQQERGSSQIAAEQLAVVQAYVQQHLSALRHDTAAMCKDEVMRFKQANSSEQAEVEAVRREEIDTVCLRLEELSGLIETRRGDQERESEKQRRMLNDVLAAQKAAVLAKDGQLEILSRERMQAEQTMNEALTVKVAQVMKEIGYRHDLLAESVEAERKARLLMEEETRYVQNEQKKRKEDAVTMQLHLEELEGRVRAEVEHSEKRILDTISLKFGTDHGDLSLDVKSLQRKLEALSKETVKLAETDRALADTFRSSKQQQDQREAQLEREIFSQLDAHQENYRKNESKKADERTEERKKEWDRLEGERAEQLRVFDEFQQEERTARERAQVGFEERRQEMELRLEARLMQCESNLQSVVKSLDNEDVVEEREKLMQSLRAQVQDVLAAQAAFESSSVQARNMAQDKIDGQVKALHNSVNKAQGEMQENSNRAVHACQQECNKVTQESIRTCKNYVDNVQAALQTGTAEMVEARVEELRHEFEQELKAGRESYLVELRSLQGTLERRVKEVEDRCREWQDGGRAWMEKEKDAISELIKKQQELTLVREKESVARMEQRVAQLREQQDAYVAQAKQEAAAEEMRRKQEQESQRQAVLAWEKERKAAMAADEERAKVLKAEQAKKVEELRKEFEFEQKKWKQEQQASAEALKKELQEHKTAFEKEREKEKKEQQERAAESVKREAARQVEWKASEEKRQEEMKQLQATASKELDAAQTIFRKQMKSETEKAEQRLAEMQKNQDKLLEERRAEEVKMAKEREIAAKAFQVQLQEQQGKWKTEKADMFTSIGSLQTVIERMDGAFKESLKKLQLDIDDTVDVKLVSIEETLLSLANEVKDIHADEKLDDMMVLVEGLQERADLDEEDLTRCVSEIKSLKGVVTERFDIEKERVEGLINDVREDTEGDITKAMFEQQSKMDKVTTAMTALTSKYEGVSQQIEGKFTKFQMQMDKFRQQAEVWEGKSVNAEMQRKKDGKRLDALEAAK